MRFSYQTLYPNTFFLFFYALWNLSFYLMSLSQKTKLHHLLGSTKPFHSEFYNFRNSRFFCFSQIGIPCCVWFSITAFYCFINQIVGNLMISIMSQLSMKSYYGFFCFGPPVVYHYHYHYHLILFFDQSSSILKPVTSYLLQPLFVFCGQETQHGYRYFIS